MQDGREARAAVSLAGRETKQQLKDHLYSWELGDVAHCYPQAKNPSLSLASTALLSQVTLITVDFSATPFVHNYVASRA